MRNCTKMLLPLWNALETFYCNYIHNISHHNDIRHWNIKSSNSYYFLLELVFGVFNNIFVHTFHILAIIRLILLFLDFCRFEISFNNFLLVSHFSPPPTFSLPSFSLSPSPSEYAWLLPLFLIFSAIKLFITKIFYVKNM